MKTLNGVCVGETSASVSPIIVADAGPIIHLDELGCLELLADFKQVLVPDAVWLEVERHRPEALLRLPSVLFRQSVPNTLPIIDALAAMYTLHLGEREALACCLLQPHSMLLTDDTAARLAAKSIGVAAHGTIGLLIRAVRCKLRTKDEVLQLLGDIQNRTTLHIRPSFLVDVIREVELKL